MKSEEIEVTVRECGYALPFKLYRAVCESPQVDHVLRNGNKYHVWTNDGQHWEVTVKPA